LYVDVLALLTLTILTVLGWWTGAFIQLSRLVALAVIFLFGPTLAELVYPLVIGIVSPSSGLAYPLSYLLAAVVFYMAAVILSRVVRYLVVRGSESLSSLDKTGGLFLGALKAIAIVYVGVAVIYASKPYLQQLDPENQLRYEESRLLTTYRTANVLSPWELYSFFQLQSALRVAVIAEVNADIELEDLNSGAAEFIDRDSVRKLLSDKEVKKNLKRQQGWRLVMSEKVREFLKREQNVAAMGAVDWGRLLAKVQARRKTSSKTE
jgi:uncharacterized membrane protein required for colicin V production